MKDFHLPSLVEDSMRMVNWNDVETRGNDHLIYTVRISSPVRETT